MERWYHIWYLLSRSSFSLCSSPCTGNLAHPFGKSRCSVRVLRTRCAHWTKPLTSSLLFGTLADLARSKSELMAENALLRQQIAFFGAWETLLCYVHGWVPVLATCDIHSQMRLLRTPYSSTDIPSSQHCTNAKKVHSLWAKRLIANHMRRFFSYRDSLLILPSLHHLPESSKLTEMICIMISHDKDFAKNILAVPMRNRRIQIYFWIRYHHQQTL